MSMFPHSLPVSFTCSSTASLLLFLPTSLHPHTLLAACNTRPPLTPPSQTVESPLFLLHAVHEALDLDSTSFSPTALPSSAPALSVGGAALDRLFGDEVWGRLPMATGDAGAGAEAGGGGGQNGGKGEREAETRLRQTALGVVDTYAAYFTTRAPGALLAPLRYVLGALGDTNAGVCLQVEEEHEGQSMAEGRQRNEDRHDALGRP
ncbi:hypothetical protein DFH08DRAFT_941913 [Mycena albidolilacea]|uniref:Uncharacterized protein n=1 Tax=Mycena albidolilacea TaxID=1033008 RepID=A0AAD7EG49_9AGAR|nr:hypothetical protein DFH08DRAFT_941913 [Mycena albidolilacea]